MHRTDSKIAQIWGRWLLAFTWDTGFSIEHVYGHHRYVGTEQDPATPRRGEYIMTFQRRSTKGQMINAYKHERERLKRKGIKDQIWNNRFWRGQMMTVVRRHLLRRCCSGRSACRSRCSPPMWGRPISRW